MKFLNVIPKDGYQIIQLDRGKANTINLALVDELLTQINLCKADVACGGIILIGKPGFFSAGLDVKELYTYDRSDMDHFNRQFGKLYVEMIKFPKPMIAAITGHAPAGGTVLGMPCDYRVMIDDPKFTIGLNEILVNVNLSTDIISGYKFWLGEGTSARLLLQGSLLPGTEAKKIGLVDDCVAGDKILEAAETQMKKYLQAEPVIFSSIKSKIRKEWIDSLGKNEEAELAESADIWWSDSVRGKIKELVDRLTNK